MIVKQATVKNLMKRWKFRSVKKAREMLGTHANNELHPMDFCICAEWDGKGLSTCGFYCAVHNPKAWTASKEEKK